MTSTGSAARGIRLARTLRRWRLRTGYSIERVAEELLCGAGTIHRMETGESGAQPLRVKAALELYGAPPAVVADMVEAAKQRRKGGVVRHPYHDLVSAIFAEYLDMENEASHLFGVEGDLVHGLLQTEDYAKALIQVGSPQVKPSEVGQHLALRLERQKRLFGDSPLNLRVVLGEGALRYLVGGPKIMHRQLIHLADLMTNVSNVEVRVYPFSAGAHPALGRNFTMLSFGDTEEPDMIFAENVSYFVLQDEIDEVAQFRVSYDHVWARALKSAASVKLITTVASEIDV